MNDRYLYRAKRTDNGEWVEGHYITNEKDPNHAYIGYLFGVVDGMVHDTDIVEVIPSTICQCTGLKDKNGKLIWENDIVKRVDKRNIFREQPSMNCKVVWTYNYGFDTLPSCGYFDKSDRLECEVVGNIFDNPELLGVGL